MKGFIKSSGTGMRIIIKGEMSGQRKFIFQYFEKNKLAYKTTCRIKISGHASRSFPQKSLRLIANKSEKIRHDFFGEAGFKKYKSIVFRNSGNDNRKTMFGDLLSQNLVRNCNVLCQRGRAVNVFLNGKYWGNL